MMDTLFIDDALSIKQCPAYIKTVRWLEALKNLHANCTTNVKGSINMKKAIIPHWIKHSHFLGRDEYECSVCGARYKYKSKNCPNCDAVLSWTMDQKEWLNEAILHDEMLDDN